jgi:hypothetical protein
MTDEELKSRLEIQEVIYTYCRGVDRGDAALIASAYHDDAQDDHGTFKGLGKDFAPHIVKQMERNGAIGQHHVTNILIKFLSPDAAEGESYVIALNPEPGGRVGLVYNRYWDRFERRDGKWKIARRMVIIDYAQPEPDGSPWARLPHFSQGGRREKDPTGFFFGK